MVANVRNCLSGWVVDSSSLYPSRLSLSATDSNFKTIVYYVLLLVRLERVLERSYAKVSTKIQAVSHIALDRLDLVAGQCKRLIYNINNYIGG